VNEDHIVEKIAAAFSSKQRAKTANRRLVLGIGDDAAIMRPRPGADWVVTTDAFIEGVHFLPTHPADSAGYKALARATSDIAAMGAQPSYFLLTLGVPATRTARWLSRFLGGMSRAARELQLSLVGGDTTKTDDVIVSITVIGEIRRGLAVRRSGAKPGDRIYVSGKLGAAEVGLQLALKGQVRRKSLQPYLQPHLCPRIRLKLGQWLAHHRIASAMMDISDGLSTDLRRLCAASRVGARLNADSIPCIAIPSFVARRLGNRCDPLKMALHGGEDYQLLFTVPQEHENRLRLAPRGSEISRIGEIVPGSGVVLVSSGGRGKNLLARGWDPFRRQ